METTCKITVNGQSIQNELYYDNKLLLKYTIKYPQFKSEEHSMFLKELNRFYRNKAIDYSKNNIMQLYRMAIDDYKYSVAQGFPVHEYEAIIDYKVTYNKNCILSLYFDQYEYTGGAHGNTIRYSDTWNVKIGKRMPLSSFFPKNMNYMEYIEKSIVSQINSQIEAGNSYYFENSKELVHDTLKEDNFYLEGENIVIYFQQYDIGPYVMGILTFPIKRMI